MTRWRQIADALGREVARLPAGEALPSEQRLADRFGVNRHTARRALEELSRAGLIRIEQGRGMFVAEDVPGLRRRHPHPLLRWIRRHNREPSGRVLDLRPLPAPAAVAAGLGIAAGDPAILFERLGLADGRPVSLASHYFPAARLTGMFEALRDQPGITAALASVGVPDYLRQSTRVSARLPSPTEATLLAMARGLPVLMCENVNVDRGGRIVEFAIARYPTPRVQVVFEPGEAGA